MRQFDVYANPVGPDARLRPHLVLLTSHYIDLDTVIVAPLLSAWTIAVPDVQLEVTLDGEPRLLTLIQMTAIRPRMLRQKVGSLAHHEEDIRRAIDRLFTGF